MLCAIPLCNHRNRNVLFSKEAKKKGGQTLTTYMRGKRGKKGKRDRGEESVLGEKISPLRSSVVHRLFLGSLHDRGLCFPHSLPLPLASPTSVLIVYLPGKHLI